MTLEACQILGWPFAGIAHRLRANRNEIAKLTKSRQALDDILRMSIHVLPVGVQEVVAAGDLSRQHGLLSGDALILAVMQSQHFTCLASNDADFDRVPGITRFAPQ
jgi:predicted nucleic acid-binding protein